MPLSLFPLQSLRLIGSCLLSLVRCGFRDGCFANIPAGLSLSPIPAQVLMISSLSLPSKNLPLSCGVGSRYGGGGAFVACGVKNLA